MTITAPTLDTITGNTVMVKMRELIKQMTIFAKEVADLVNTIPTDVQDTYSREEVDDMIDELDTAISTLSDSVYPKSEVYTKNDVYTKTESDALINPKANANNVYTKSEVYTKNETDALVNPKANANNVYTKSEVYTKTETDTLIFPKANSSNVYNKAEIDNFLSSKQDELTAGTGIDITNNVISVESANNFIKLNSTDWSSVMESSNVGSAGYLKATKKLLVCINSLGFRYETYIVNIGEPVFSNFISLRNMEVNEGGYITATAITPKNRLEETDYISTNTITLSAHSIRFDNNTDTTSDSIYTKNSTGGNTINIYYEE